MAPGPLIRSIQRLNARHPWSHNAWFHGWVLSRLPDPCRSVLDVGCGRGDLLAALAPYAGEVVGVDRDDTVRDAAIRRAAAIGNVRVVEGPWQDAGGPYDAVTMVAVLHHLDLEPALRDVVRLLAPGGRFLVVGLARPRTVVDHLWDLVCVVTNPVIGWVTHPWPARRLRDDPSMPTREPALSLAEVQAALDRVMPGATVRRRLGFRHTVEWTAPGRPNGGSGGSP